MRLKKKERQRNGRRNICKEGRGKKPKMQASLNSQAIRKVKKSKKTKQNKVKIKLYITMKARWPKHAQSVCFYALLQFTLFCLYCSTVHTKR